MEPNLRYGGGKMNKISISTEKLILDKIYDTLIELVSETYPAVVRCDDSVIISDKENNYEIFIKQY